MATNTNIKIKTLSHPNFGQIRTLKFNNECWLVATDVCKVLGVKNVTQAISRLEEDEHIKMRLCTQGQPANCVNKSGLLSLVLGSHKSKPLEFKHWLVDEIIPFMYKSENYILE